jgi:AraC family transcriptional regulator of adaptative response/methylated-DNA-[protein]-cysteine methyltransferase
LAENASVLDAALEAGLSGPGRLHDLFVVAEAVTPGEAKRLGEGLEIVYGVHDSPFGRCLIGATSRGVCWLGFVLDDGDEGARDALARRWPGARLRRDDAATAALAARVFAGDAGDRPALHLRGTNFQLRVWEALLRIPPGSAVAYGDVARAIGAPESARAVGAAVALNPVAYLVPCHRVIRRTGPFHGYAWGRERKQAMLGWEGARRRPDAA